MSQTFEYSLKLTDHGFEDAEGNLFESRKTIDDCAGDVEYIRQAELCSARDLQATINTLLGTSAQVIDMTDAHFDRVYNPQCPTILYDVNNMFSGAELLGIANARSTNKKVNIIYGNMATVGMTYESTDDGRPRPVIARGHLVNAQGQVLYGDFLKDVPIMAIETVDPELLSHFESQGIPTLSSTKMMQHFNDKQLLETIEEKTGIIVPRRFTLDELKEGNDIVIKPSTTSQGRGVYFGKQHNRQLADWKRYYTYLANHGYEPVIEERIACWPLFDPETGDRLDWNVRAIVNAGGLIDMYIRAGAEASAVNKSTGAKAILTQDIGEYLGDTPIASAQVIRESLRIAAGAFAEAYPDTLFGIDLTINTRGEVVLFEANAGNVGGVQTIASLSKRTTHSKLRPAKALLDALPKQLNNRSVTSTPGEGFDAPPMTASMRLNFAYQTQLVHLIDAEHLSPNTNRYTETLMMSTQLMNEALSMHAPDLEPIVRAITKNPLEAAMLMHRFPNTQSVIGSTALRAMMEDSITTDEWTAEAKKAQVFLALQEDDLAKVLTFLSTTKDKPMIAYIIRGMYRTAEESLRGLDFSENESAHVRELLAATLALIAGYYQKDRFNDVDTLAITAEAFMEAAKDLPYLEVSSLLARIFSLMGRYDLAEFYLHAIDMNDEQVVDYHIDTLNCHQDLFIKTEDGQRFIARNYGGLGGYDLLRYEREKGMSLPEDVERLLVQEQSLQN